MLPQLIDICANINQALLPQHCLLCAAPAQAVALCDACKADLPWQADDVCPSCALPSPRGQTCGACLNHPPAFDRTFAALTYRHPIDAVLQRYKYANLLTAAELLSTLICNKVEDARMPDVLIPMPLHASRLKERGFNQALEIARVVAKRLSIPLDARCCIRTRPTQAQAGLSLQERRKNLRGVFACRSDLSGRQVVLLDDVMTSGASLSELAKTAKKAGAASVECWVVARTVRL